LNELSARHSVDASKLDSRLRGHARGYPSGEELGTDNSDVDLWVNPDGEAFL